MKDNFPNISKLKKEIKKNSGSIVVWTYYCDGHFIGCSSEDLLPNATDISMSRATPSKKSTESEPRWDWNDSTLLF